MDDLEKGIYDSMHDMEGPSDCLLKEALDRLRTYREALEAIARNPNIPAVVLHDFARQALKG